jgi:hypothetical protein
LLTHLNCYTNVYSPTITATLTNQDWFAQLSSTEHKTTIDAIRALKLLYNQSRLPSIKRSCDDLKKSLPAITWNARFTGKKEDKNFVQGTGLIYIDIDSPEFDINILDLNKVYAYYKSVGGIGYSILVRVDGINPENFKSTYISICSDQGILSYVDQNAIKLTQSNILSYDEDIYINDNCFIYTSVLPLNNFVPNTPHNIKKEEKHMRGVGYKIEKALRYTNIDDFDFQSDYIQNWNEGFNFVKCYIPSHKLTDGRKMTLLSFATNLVWLNGNLPYIQLYNCLKNVNQRLCVTPLPDQYITSILKQLLQLAKESKLYPLTNIRRILFKPNSGLSIDDKREITNALLREKYANESSSRINSIIEDWNFILNGKITIRSVASAGQIDKKTVAKYWSQFKDYVQSYNLLKLDEIKAFKAHQQNLSKDIQDNDIIPYVPVMTPQILMEQAMITNPEVEKIEQNYEFDIEEIDEFLMAYLS